MSSEQIGRVIRKIARREILSEEDMEAALEDVLTGRAAPEQLAAFMTGLAVRGETAGELAAGARAMLKHAQRIELAGPILDNCGTGGLPWVSLNTSTAAAIVMAAAGVRIAKHGNRSVPPKTGTADVLEALGVAIEMDTQTARYCLDQAGIVFLFARSHHGAMRHAAPVRHILGIRTLFNLLGPLSNPAGAEFRLLGVAEPQWLRPMAEALRQLGIHRAWVVHGKDGVDEISISDGTLVCELINGELREFEIVPGDAGLTNHPASALAGGNAAYNAEQIRDLLNGKHGAFHDHVVINAAAGLVIAGKALSLQAGADIARQALVSGRARTTLEALVTASQGQK